MIAEGRFVFVAGQGPLKDGGYVAATLNVVVSVGLGVAAAAAGWALGTGLIG